jgi:hypothetical protein
MGWQGWVAIYGAVLSSFLAWLQFRQSRRKLKVTCRLGTASSIISGEPENPVIEVDAVNIGHRPVEVQEMVLLTTAGGTISEGRNVYRRGALIHLPELLRDGEAVTAKFYLSEVTRYLNALNAAGKLDPPVRLSAAVVTDSERKARRGQLPHNEALARYVQPH